MTNEQILALCKRYIDDVAELEQRLKIAKLAERLAKALLAARGLGELEETTDQ